MSDSDNFVYFSFEIKVILRYKSYRLSLKVDSRSLPPVAPRPHAMTIAATTTTATAAPTRAQWWSHQGSTGSERTASSSRDDSSGSTTYQYS